MPVPTHATERAISTRGTKLTCGGDGLLVQTPYARAEPSILRTAQLVETVALRADLGRQSQMISIMDGSATAKDSVVIH